MAKNVLCTELECCCKDPMTGFYRTGSCETGPGDYGLHLICARMTQEFLDFSKEHGNDLSTPMLEYGFPGLQPGDKWCLCVARWLEAHKAGVAPPVFLKSTHILALEHVDLEVLQKYAIDPEKFDED